MRFSRCCTSIVSSSFHISAQNSFATMAVIKHSLGILLLIVAFVTYLHGKTIGTAEPTATNTIDNDRTGKPLTSAEIEQWQQSMGNKINPEANRIYGEILRNHFQAGSTQTDHIKGIVNLLVLFTATGSNATEDDLGALFNPGKKGNEDNTITTNALN